MSRFYASFGEWLDKKSPSLYRIGKLGVWTLKFLKRHLRAAAAGFGVLAGLISAPLLVDSLHPFAIYFWTSSAFVASVGFFVMATAFTNSMVARFNARSQLAEQSLRRAIEQSLRRAIEQSAEQTRLRQKQSAEQTRLGQQIANDKVTAEIKEVVSEVSMSKVQTKDMQKTLNETRIQIAIQTDEIRRLRERIAAGERQIGALRYQNPPDCFVFFGHHKCGSRFFRFEVFDTLIEKTGARLRHYQVQNPPFHYSRMDELDLCNIDFSNLGEDGRDVVMFANSSTRSLDKIKSSANHWKGLRIIRDPRQVLVSNYFHHQKGHRIEFNGWIWDQLAQDRPILEGLPQEEGILYELDRRKVNP